MLRSLQTENEACCGERCGNRFSDRGLEKVDSRCMHSYSLQAFYSDQACLESYFIDHTWWNCLLQDFSVVVQTWTLIKDSSQIIWKFCLFFITKLIIDKTGALQNCEESSIL